jgi:predicted helicase
MNTNLRESGALVADNLKDMVPNTNPFLKDLMQTFLTVGGRKGKMDFDELGINEVVELLRHTQMNEVLKDFGAKNPQEDPVIHFYELFLKEYDPEKRMKRGVFYTPRPVVSFIVRSVDEILRTEFALEDGLADTMTWGEMLKRHEGLTIPQGVKANEPFVQILDPATGTGTFLVEVIDRINETLTAKWKKQGKSEREMYDLWNDYVPRHLLPRLHGFELMMSPYAIAHMKIGLKLRETHYSFLSWERARIYLTNTLEEPKDFSSYLEQMAPSLAHEAQEANKVKKSALITVVACTSEV